MDSSNEQIWETVERPGFLGEKRNGKYSEWNEKYGEGKWRLAWKIKIDDEFLFVDYNGACVLYEDAYLEFLQKNLAILEMLVNEAGEIYDNAPSNVESGFDYRKQETISTHIQDIAIRHALLRLGLWFRGTELIQIRSSSGGHPLSKILSPGNVPFHKPELIERPELKGWWSPGSVEAFYQSCKYLQVRKF